VSCNDFGAVCSPLLSEKSLETIKEVLGVKATPMKIADLDITGSCIVATRKGFFVNPNIADADLAALENIMKVSGGAGSLNYGSQFVKSGILANSRGCICGEETTAIELGKIDDSLFFKK
jgi:translation initiation factor 6